MKLLNRPYRGRQIYKGQSLQFADFLFILANVGFLLVFSLLVFVWQLPGLAVLLALASKWRMVALRPRYWTINIRSNLVDLIFIVGVTLLAVHPSSTITAQVIWLLFLAFWMLFVKRMSSKTAILFQSASALLIGLSALFYYAALINISQLFFITVVLGSWVILYAVARHVLVIYASESKIDFFALLWGFVGSEVTWIMAHWSQTYKVIEGIEIPQTALILLLLSFAAHKVYSLQSYVNENEDDKLKKKSTKSKLSSTYGAVGFSLVLIIIILINTKWTISV